jgi:Zn-dependent protease with chaperone function
MPVQKRFGTYAFATIVLLIAPGGISAAAKEKVEKVEGYAEWRRDATLIVDGQRLQITKQTRLKLPKGVASLEAVPLGYEVKAKGVRAGDGVVVAREIELKPNGSALFESEAKDVTDQMEARWLRAGSVYEEDGEGDREDMGELYTEGPEVERVRAIVNDLVPPYLEAEDFRVYVVDNDEWNAFACANRMICVNMALLDDMDDDELAIILGHEIAHATHEHTRREFKKAMWTQLAALGILATAEAIEDREAKSVVQLATLFSIMAWRSGYGRHNEDQADRVGLRYAYEAGYDVRKGPGLWERFARRYGEPGKVANFFFGNHSLSTARAKNLRQELLLNYAESLRD